MAERHALRFNALLRPIRAQRVAYSFESRLSCTLRPITSPRTTATLYQPQFAIRSFQTSRSPRIDILESADKPETVKQPEEGLRASQATPMSDEEYHEISDKFMGELQEKMEEKSEETGDFDVEYSAGVMNISVLSKGTYVINKQPPNKQIWLSSPESGPKRYDWVVQSESMEHKEGSGAAGDWIYLRDGSSLTALIRNELGVSLSGAGQEL